MAVDFEFPFRLIHDLPERAQRELQRDFQAVAATFGDIHSPFTVVADDGTGDYTSIKTAIETETAAHDIAVIYVKPTTKSPGEYTDVGDGAVTIGLGTTALYLFGPDFGDYGGDAVNWLFDSIAVPSNDGETTMDIGIVNLYLQPTTSSTVFSDSSGVVTSTFRRCFIQGHIGTPSNIIIDRCTCNLSVFGITSVTNTSLLVSDSALQAGWMTASGTYESASGGSFIIKDSIIKGQVTTTLKGQHSASATGMFVFARNKWVTTAAATITVTDNDTKASYLWVDNYEDGSSSGLTTWELQNGLGSTNGPQIVMSNNVCLSWTVNVDYAGQVSFSMSGTYNTVEVSSTTSGAVFNVVIDLQGASGTGMTLHGNRNAVILGLTRGGASSTGLVVDGNDNIITVAGLSNVNTPWTNTGLRNIINDVVGGAGLPMSTQDFSHEFLGQAADATHLRHYLINPVRPVDKQGLVYNDTTKRLEWTTITDASAVHTGDSAAPWLAGTYPSPRTGPDFTQLFLTTKREQYVDHIRRMPISATGPSAGQVLTFNATTGQLEWDTPSAATNVQTTGDFTHEFLFGKVKPRLTPWFAGIEQTLRDGPDFTHPFVVPQGDGNARRISHITIDKTTEPPTDKKVLAFNAATKMLGWVTPTDAAAIHSGDAAGPWFAGTYPSPRFGPDLTEAFLIPGGTDAKTLRHITVAPGRPTDQYVLTYVAATGMWTAQAAPGGVPTGSAGPWLAGTYPSPRTGPDLTQDLLFGKVRPRTTPWLAGIEQTLRPGPDFTHDFLVQPKTLVDHIYHYQIAAPTNFNNFQSGVGLTYDGISKLVWTTISTPSDAVGPWLAGNLAHPRPGPDFTQEFVTGIPGNDARSLRHISIAPGKPTDQYVLTYVASTGMWTAQAAAGGAPTGSAGPWFAGTYPSPKFGPDLTEAFLAGVPSSNADANRLRHLRVASPIGSAALLPVLTYDNLFGTGLIWVDSMYATRAVTPWLAGTASAPRTGPDFTQLFLTGAWPSRRIVTGNTPSNISVHNLPWELPWGEVIATPVTSDATTYTSLATNSNYDTTFTAVKNRKYMITFHGHWTEGVPTIATEGAQSALLDGATQLQLDWFAAAGNGAGTFTMVWRGTLSAGQHTLHVQIGRVGGAAVTITMSTSATAPGFLTVDDMGPSGAMPG